MNKDFLKSIVKNVDTQLFEIVNNLICSICQELFNKPVTTPCGHSFCNGCIKRVLSTKSNSGCPLCKNPVKRYGLETDEVKLKFSEICKELPLAFEEDVKELTTSTFDLGEDIIRASKLSQLYNQESVKESKKRKHKFTAIKKAQKLFESVQSDNDSESFCPVLKRVKNVVEYASAKKKKMDDLVSISQTELASSSSLGDSAEVNKKLEKIEKIPPEEKINKWFNAVGDNIFINSPGFSILESNTKSESECEKKEEDKPSLIRRDYNKGVCSKYDTATTVPVKDPYEFVPSQNSKAVKKKRPKRSTAKKIPDFKTLQSFSKESIKRNMILLDESKDEISREGEVKDLHMESRATASQKFEQLLLESNEDLRKGHALYLPSQSSSAQFLDVSFNSKVNSSGVKKTPGTNKKTTGKADILFKNVESLSGEKRGRSRQRPKRKRSSDTVNSSKKQKLFSEVKSTDTHELEKSMEKYVLERPKWDFPPTKLEEILKELLDDDIIYATRPANAPVRLPEIFIHPQDRKAGVTQNTELIGFCTQEECPNEKTFKRLVRSMEEELNSSEILTRIQEPKECQSPGMKFHSIESLVSADENGNCQPKKCKTSCIEFLHLGRLTPVRKRAKSTVVKVFFPIGLTSLARRRMHQTSHASPPHFARRPALQVSTGIQTAQEQPVSCLVQTSQVHQAFAAMQTSQEERSSVEIQTTQKCNASAGVQTSQKFVCQEIQTTQIEYGSANVQTTLTQEANPQTPKTHPRRPPYRHRKILIGKKSSDNDLFTPQKYLPPEREVLMDSDVEEEFENKWRNTQKHDRFVEIKNKINKENNEVVINSRKNAFDLDSDDSDVQPPKRRPSHRILSEESLGIAEDFQTRQMTPLTPQKVTHEDEMEVIQLDTPKSKSSNEQMRMVLKNIDLDLPKSRSIAKGEKSEESDSDFFVEQTPPRPSSRCLEDIRNFSRSRSAVSSAQKQPPSEKQINYNLDGIDLIGDSMPKGFSESFMSLDPPQKVSPEKTHKEDVQKINLKIPPTIDLPNENDQNQMNAFEDKKPFPREEEAKALQVRAVVDEWKMSTTPGRTAFHKTPCIVASGVKNPELIKTFANRFKLEYLNKPTKDMTHLIVGLHENEENEVLPLCTPKLLFAMANKKWVVSELWAESCLRVNTILPEESFETLDPIGGCGCKRARMCPEKLLRNCEVFLLGEFQMISKEDFADLIVDCGGSLVSTPERFSFLPSKLRMIIADRDCLNLDEKKLQEIFRRYSTAILSRDVIIMSIQSYNLANFSPYLLHSASEESLVKLGYPLSLVKRDEEEEEEEEEQQGS